MIDVIGASTSLQTWFVGLIVGRFMTTIGSPIVATIVRKGIKIKDVRKGKYYYVKLTKRYEKGDWEGVNKAIFDYES